MTLGILYLSFSYHLQDDFPREAVGQGNCRLFC